MKSGLDMVKVSAMREGGKRLAAIKRALAAMVKPGVTFEAIEAKAQTMIKDVGGKPSFMTVQGYYFATCITKNEGCCHGTPVGYVIDDGDIITIDVGLLYKGYHTDTTTTVYAGDASKMPAKIKELLVVGQETLDKAISKAKVGNTIYDISRTIQDTLESAGYGAVYQLTGHSIGKTLHEDPYVPCVAFRQDKKLKLFEGQTIAIEPMYAMGNPYLVVGRDGWRYETKDKSLTGMFEDTILITKQGPEILTR